MEEFEKVIYNTYLKVIAAKQQRAFSYRKNFDDLGVEKRGDLIKLSNFLKRYPHIQVEKFLESPYKLFEDTKFFPLKFYTKRRALSAYITYKKQLINLPPDNEYQINTVVTSLKFILKFCIAEKIKVVDYIEHIDGINSCLTHLKEDNVSIYTLFGFDNFKSILYNTDSELKTLLFGSNYIDYDIMHRKYIHSKKCRELVEKGLKKIKDYGII
jgi:hypothetical protein